MQDVTAEYPYEITEFQFYNNDLLPEDMDYEKGIYCIWQGRFFIQTRATLPLKDTEKGVGFGLWVELIREDFERYAEALEDDSKYQSFSASGSLANEWPGFEGMLGAEVTVKTLNVTDKVYITDIIIEESDDPLFYKAISAPAEDAETKKQVKDLVNAYLEDEKGF